MSQSYIHIILIQLYISKVIYGYENLINLKMYWGQPILTEGIAFSKISLIYVIDVLDHLR